MKHIFYAIIKIEVESNLILEKAMEQFEQDTLYSFRNTNDCIVKDTEYLETIKEYT